MDSMLQPNETDLLNGLKQNKTKQKKTNIYAVYKRPTSKLGTYTD